MGTQTFKIRPLALFDDGDDVESNSDTFELGDSVEVHAVCNVSAATTETAPDITAKAQHSIDGQNWADLTGLSFNITGTGTQHDSATANAYRYLRFHYVSTEETSSSSATFEIIVFVKTRT